MERLAAGLLGALLLSSCTYPLHLSGGRCADGYPARLLLDISCRDGICGATCAPDRWQPPQPCS